MHRSLVIALLIVGSAHAVAQTPVNGRTQQMTFSRDAVQAEAASAYQKKLAQLTANGQLDTDRATLERIRHITARLITQAIKLKPASANWPWEIHLTSNEEVAAFSMAGGKLLIGSHFINRYHLDDNELTVALAHEVGHVIAEHVREQLSRATTLDPPAPNMTLSVSDVINAMNSDISLYLRLQPLSRLQELEADDIGIELAALAGTPAKSIRSFYKKITADESEQTIFDTHGSSRQRDIFANSMTPYAALAYKAAHHTRRHVYVFR